MRDVVRSFADDASAANDRTMRPSPAWAHAMTPPPTAREGSATLGATTPFAASSVMERVYATLDGSRSFAAGGGAVADEIVIKPPRLLELEEDAGGGLELLVGEVEDEASVPIVQRLLVGAHLGLQILWGCRGVARTSRVVRG